MSRLTIAIAILIVSSIWTSVLAETERDTFKKQFFRTATLEAALYDSCALVAYSDKGKNASLWEITRAISNRCAKEADQLRRELAREEGETGKADSLFRVYRRLVINELSLLKQGKPIPGEKRDPSVEHALKCLRTITEKKLAFTDCTNTAVKEIAPLSRESADVVADGAIGRCANEKAQLEAIPAIQCHFGGHDKGMYEAIDRFENLVRSALVGKVVGFRAELERRRQTPPTSRTPRKDQRIGSVSV